MRYFTVLLAIILTAVLLSCEKTEEKKQPEAAFTISPATGPFTTTFTFDGSISTDEDGVAADLQVRWDWEGDGFFDTELSPTKILDHKYEEPGNYDVVLEIINPDGWSDREVKTLIVFADSTPPIASFTVDPDSSSVNTIFLFDASSSTDLYSSLEEMSFRWDWQNDGNWDTEFTRDSTIYYKYSTPGTYKAVLEVKNKYSVTDTTRRTIYVFDL
jgi:PKD repeat protein